MKPSQWLLCSLMTIALTGFVAPAHATGGGSTGGGDAAEVEFSNIGRAIVNTLIRSNAPVQYDLNLLSLAVSSTQVTMVRHPILLEGKQRDAINLPALKQIEVDRNNWISLRPIHKLELVYHEYLGIAGIESNSYRTSQSLTSLLSSDDLKKLSGSYLPELRYSCSVTRDTTVGANVHREACGQVEIGQHSRGMIEVRNCGVLVTFMNFHGYNKTGMSVSLRKSGNGDLSAFNLDPYSAPAAFALELRTYLNEKTSDMNAYLLSCSIISD